MWVDGFHGGLLSGTVPADGEGSGSEKEWRAFVERGIVGDDEDPA